MLQSHLQGKPTYPPALPSKRRLPGPHASQNTCSRTLPPTKEKRRGEGADTRWLP